MMITPVSLDAVHTHTHTHTHTHINLIEENRVDNIYSKTVANRLLFSKQEPYEGLFVK